MSGKLDNVSGKLKDMIGKSKNIKLNKSIETKLKAIDDNKTINK